MKVVIIGGIAAGMSAAAKLRRVDPKAEVIVFEQSAHISFGACGLPYYVGGFFDDDAEMLARTVEEAQASGINVKVQHQVTSVDVNRKVVTVKNLVTGETFEQLYDKLMIATGASAVVPPIKNLELHNIYHLRSMEDGHILREKMRDDSIKTVGIVGAGFIGLEVVEAAKRLGKKVYVFQLEDRILKESFDVEITKRLEEHLVEEDVNLLVNTKVIAFEGKEKVEQVVTEHEKIPVDLVVMATGVRPNTEFLKDTGIEMASNGAILVDKEGRTSIPDIYAAGDCIAVPHFLKDTPSYIPLATSANKLGRIVGENLGGGHECFEGTLGSSCLKVMHMEAGRTGLSENEAQVLGIDYKTVCITDKSHTSYYPGQEAVSIKLIYHAQTKVIVGGQVVGKKDAVQRTNVIATAIYAGLTTRQLGMLDLCYAPPFSRTWDALNIAGNVAK